MIHLDTLEFGLFKQYMEKGFSSALAKGRLNALKPYYALDKIERYKAELNEALDYAVKASDIYIPKDDEFLSVLPKLNDPLLFLEPDELLIFAEFFHGVRDIKKGLIEHGAEHMKLYLGEISTLSEITDRIDETVNDMGEVKDSASYRLSEVRGELKSLRKQVQRELAGVFAMGSASKFVQEQVITERSGRFTIPCKTNFKQYMQGIVHDRSASGQTFFVEPSSTVGLNNAIQECLAQEREETVRILKEIADSIFGAFTRIQATVAAYTEVVFHLETAKFYKGKDFVFPEFSGSVMFRDVHHPIIFLEKGKESVPLDFQMMSGEFTAVITGPNTGGKTAALKSIGLNHILGKCGLPLFGKYAEIVNFNHILADIGDNQSLVMDLSTFSAHMVNIRDILKTADSQSLVLLDEAGTGTEPREGAALAVAVCRKLAAKKAKAVVTTHFTELKTYALTEDTSVIYAVDFDYTDFSPRYRLLKGVSGKSDPLVIAKRLRFPADVIETATDIIEQHKSDAEVSVEEISRMQAEIAGKTKDLELLQAYLKEKEEFIELREQELSEKLAKKESELLEEALRLYHRAKKYAEKPHKIKESVEEDIKKAETKLGKVKKEIKPVEGVKTGDVIWLEKYDKSGKVLSVDGDSAKMDIGGLKISIKLKELVGKKMEQKDRVKDVLVSKNVAPSAKHELLLVGKRVEEALDILDKTLDESVLAGLNRLYVVHGRGTGQLRSGIQEFLRSDPRVRAYKTASNEEGGQAVTVIDF
ncbi:endonuclease MutS2 [Seleniivibrio woodruffii]|uniref:endonuclease MutS2 n=1 Tax=Seleniivibrio woodruffii TaxID=1078050 RepID=UPI0026EC15E0|nr:Smr/MutS family protein [Seleniivibrio woodruffii]